MATGTWRIALIERLYAKKADVPKTAMSIDATAPIARVVDNILSECRLARGREQVVRSGYLPSARAHSTESSDPTSSIFRRLATPCEARLSKVAP